MGISLSSKKHIVCPMKSLRWPRIVVPLAQWDAGLGGSRFLIQAFCITVLYELFCMLGFWTESICIWRIIIWYFLSLLWKPLVTPEPSLSHTWHKPGRGWGVWSEGGVFRVRDRVRFRKEIWQGVVGLGGPGFVPYLPFPPFPHLVAHFRFVLFFWEEENLVEVHKWVLFMCNVFWQSPGNLQCNF